MFVFDCCISEKPNKHLYLSLKVALIKMFVRKRRFCFFFLGFVSHLKKHLMHSHNVSNTLYQEANFTHQCTFTGLGKCHCIMESCNCLWPSCIVEPGFDKEEDKT